MKYAAALILLLTVFASSSPDAAPACAVKAAPAMAMAPVRFVRSRVTIEARDGGRLQLDDPDGIEVTAGAIQAGPRTTQVEWSNVVLGPGEYSVTLWTPSCTAHDLIRVVGGEPN